MARDQVDMTPIETRDELVAWLEAGCKPKAQFRVGTEHEKFAFTVADLSGLAPLIGAQFLLLGSWRWMFVALAAFTVAYLVLVDATKAVFYTEPVRPAGQPHRTRGHEHRVHRRAARFSHSGRLAPMP